mmetsp:Transcript_3806/g.5721  ORF Transcript_3806/g.5721 Transcript_3806/m.5721 type:complete len:219 (+) Transcript_3806:100-756(+)
MCIINRSRATLSLALLLVLPNAIQSFAPHNALSCGRSSEQQEQTQHRPLTSILHAADGDSTIDVDHEELEPGTMRVSEIKSELDLRGVDYSDCFDKESLAKKLVGARASGKADPSIIDQFNKQRLEDNISGNELEIDDEILKKATGGDGTLPGGMPPEMLQQLMSNPELMTLMSNPKMQDVMKLMMTGGQEALEREMQKDKDVYEIVTKLNSIMGGAM